MRNTTAGRELENNFVLSATKHYGVKHVRNMIGTWEDKTQGTDLIIDGLPIDITSNISNKFMTVKCRRGFMLERYGVEVYYAVRFGNSYKGGTKFATPVLVIGVDFPGSGRVFHDLVGTICYKVGEIVDMGIDLYYETIDRLEEEGVL